MHSSLACSASETFTPRHLPDWYLLDCRLLDWYLLDWYLLDCRLRHQVTCRLPLS